MATIDKEEIPILMNTCYGGFGFSTAAKEEYLKRRLAVDPEYTSKPQYDSFYRDDPIMIEVVKELGDLANGKHAKLEIEYIDKKFKDYYRVDEYDGQESLCIDFSSYQLNRTNTNMEEIQKIIFSDDTAIEKVDKVKDILNRTMSKE